jgi:hypothetical protein
MLMPMAQVLTDGEPESGPDVAPEPQVTKKRGRGGKPRGAQRFDLRDEARMLDVVNVVHRIGFDMWDRVGQSPAPRCIGLG